MIQRLVVDCGVVFLYAAIQTSLFPMMLVTLKATHTLASVMTAAKFSSVCEGHFVIQEPKVVRAPG